MITCPECGGSGHSNDARHDEADHCLTCVGAGEISEEFANELAYHGILGSCDKCQTWGMVVTVPGVEFDETRCAACYQGEDAAPLLDAQDIAFVLKIAGYIEGGGK